MADSGNPTPPAAPAAAAQPPNIRITRCPQRYARTNNQPTRQPVSTFKDANEDIETLLGTRIERKEKDQFLIFQKSLEQHVMTSFKNAADVIVAVKEISDPLKSLMKDNVDFPLIMFGLNNMFLQKQGSVTLTLICCIHARSAHMKKLYLSIAIL